VVRRGSVDLNRLREMAGLGRIEKKGGRLGGVIQSLPTGEG